MSDPTVGYVYPNNTRLEFTLNNPSSSTSNRYWIVKFQFNLEYLVGLVFYAQPSAEKHQMEIYTHDDGITAVELSNVVDAFPVGVTNIAVLLKDDNIYVINNDTDEELFNTEFLSGDSAAQEKFNEILPIAFRYDLYSPSDVFFSNIHVSQINQESSIQEPIQEYNGSFVGDMYPNETKLLFTLENNSISTNSGRLYLPFNSRQSLHFILVMDPTTVGDTRLLITNADASVSEMVEFPNFTTFPQGITKIRAIFTNDNIYFYNDETDDELFNTEFIYDMDGELGNQFKYIVNKLTWYELIWFDNGASISDISSSKYIELSSESDGSHSFESSESSDRKESQSDGKESTTSKSGLSIGAIIGIVIGVVAAVLIVAGIVGFVIWKNKGKNLL